MRSFASYHRLSILSCCALAALLAAGCSSATTEVDDESNDALERGERVESMTLSLKIAESKQLFTSKVESFSVSDAGENGKSYPCRDREFALTSKKSLYADGWSVRDAERFSEDVEGADFREYPFAQCRDDKTQVMGWFGKERDIEFIPSEQLLDDDYKPTQLPLILKRATIGSNSVKFFSCDANFEKKLLRETETAKFFDISVACKSIAAPSKAIQGPIDFISDPGPYAAKASYASWALPAVQSNQESFEKVRRALTGKVKEGTYGGAMSTLTKTCKLDVKKSGEKLIVDHTIESSDRTRHIELTAADLIGFSEGDVYEDPNRVKGTPIGKFAAAEFRDDKGRSFVIRFEDNTSLDGKIVRINGPEAYCRRLEVR